MSVDAFTRASPLYANAMRLRANIGNPLTVQRVAYARLLLEAAGIGLFFGTVLAMAIGGAVLMGWL